MLYIVPSYLIIARATCELITQFQHHFHGEFYLSVDLQQRLIRIIRYYFSSFFPLFLCFVNWNGVAGRHVNYNNIEQ